MNSTYNSPIPQPTFNSSTYNSQIQQPTFNIRTPQPNYNSLIPQQTYIINEYFMNITNSFEGYTYIYS